MRVFSLYYVVARLTFFPYQVYDLLNMQMQVSEIMFSKSREI